MSESIDLAPLLREGDCIAWGGAAAEPAVLLEALSAALPRSPACTGFANLGTTTALDPAAVAGRMRIKALGGAGTNRRFQEVGRIDLPPFERRPGVERLVTFTLAPEGGLPVA